MPEYLKTVVKFVVPSIAGTDNLSNSIIKHFKFINRKYFKTIYLFIKEISQLHSLDYNNIKSITGIKFKIGEIEYHPKKGNLLLNIPDNLIEGIKPILEKYFNYYEIEKEWEDDEDSIITVTLNF